MRSGLSSRSSSGFTMIELMIVIAIMGMILAAGIPSIFRTMKKDELRQASADIVEGCSNARAMAILRGVPAEFVVHAEDGAMSVEQARQREGDGPKMSTGGEGESRPRSTAQVPTYKAKLGENVAVKLIYLNFKDQMQFPYTRVRFYPNGTCDEFSMIIFSDSGERLISTDVITGMANMEVVR